MQNNYTYTAADFERYHSGTMSEVQMHAIEKAALQDPFLAEALEGYTYTGTPVKDIDGLKEKLLQRKRKKNVLPVIQKQNLWLKIAAMFILIAGIGYQAYQVNFNKENTTLAKKEDEQDIKKGTKEIIIPKKDSVNTENDVAVSPDKNTENFIKENKKIEKDTKNSPETVIENSSDDLLKKSVQTTPAPEERFLNDKTEQVIVMEHNSRSLEEVVVTANDTKKQKKNLGYSTILQGKVPGVTVSDSNPQPIIGWQKFNEYVKENIKISVGNDGKNYEGKVILSFEISKRGNAKKLKVEQSLCKPCDEEAMRLLQHGPKWKYINSEREKVTIEFGK